MRVHGGGAMHPPADAGAVTRPDALERHPINVTVVIGEPAAAPATCALLMRAPSQAGVCCGAHACAGVALAFPLLRWLLHLYLLQVCGRRVAHSAQPLR